MKQKPGQVLTRRRGETRGILIRAAQREFNTRGFWGTDSNRIARAAGYSPQTFYRQFEDKTAIFVAVYDAWWKTEVDVLGKLAVKPSGGIEKAAQLAIAFHTRWRVFRRSLRILAIEEPRLREVRAAARLSQIAQARALSTVQRSDAEWAALLLASERLCDAVAEGELAELGVGKDAAHAAVARALAPLLGK